MEIMESIRAAIKELVLPDLDRIREESREIKAILTLTNKRLDDVNLHLGDQSRRIDEMNRRIDALREELTGRIDETNKRIDETNKRIDETNKRIDETNKRTDSVRDELTGRIVETGNRIDGVREELTGRINALHSDLIGRVDESNRLVVETNHRISTLYEVIVRREEHVFLTERVAHLERDLAEIKQKLAA